MQVQVWGVVHDNFLMNMANRGKSTYQCRMNLDDSMYVLGRIYGVITLHCVQYGLSLSAASSQIPGFM